MKPLYVRLPTEEAEKLDRAAFEMKTSKQDLVTGMIRRFTVETTVPDAQPYVFAIVVSGTVQIYLNAPEPAVAEYPAFKDRPIGVTLTLFVEVAGADR